MKIFPILLMMSLLLVWNVAIAATDDCYDYRKHPHLTSLAEIPEAFKAITLIGDLAVISGIKRLSVLDVSDPAVPVVLSQNDSLKITGPLALSGPWALGARRGSGLVIIDMSHPEQPLKVDVFKTVTEAREVVWENDLACVRFRSEIQFWDMTNPANPRMHSSYSEAKEPRGVILSDGLAYIADARDGVHIVDVADPEHPTQVGKPFGIYEIAQFTLVDTLLCAVVSPQYGNYHCTLVTANLANPRQPLRLGSMELPGRKPKDILIQGDLVHVLMEHENLISVDISDPTNLSGTSILGVGYGEALASLGGRVAVLHHGSLGVVVFPGSTSEIEPISVSSWSIDSTELCDFQIQEDKGYLVWKNGLFQILNLDDPFSPVLIGELAVLPKVDKMWLSPSELVIFSGSAGREALIDVRDHSAPRRIQAGSPAWKPVIPGGDILVKARHGIRFIYVSEFGFQVWVGEYERKKTFNHVVIRDGLFYTASNDKVFHVGSYADPTAPQRVGVVDNISGAPRDIILGDHLAYVVTNSPCGVQVVDVSDPSVPVLRGWLRLPGMPKKAQLYRDILYVQSISKDMYIVDVSDPDQPGFIGALKTSGGLFDMEILGGYLLQTSRGSASLSVYPLQCNP